eukprot:6192754-Heterocapsa_arctica.AAC.1
MDHAHVCYLIVRRDVHVEHLPQVAVPPSVAHLASSSSSISPFLPHRLAPSCRQSLVLPQPVPHPPPQRRGEPLAPADPVVRHQSTVLT